jgi:cell wall-associated NlpC family hydrolase
MHFIGLNPDARVPTVALIDAARSFVGTPFLHQGRNRRGLDCIGLVIAALTQVGVIYYEEPPTYTRLPRGGSLLDPLRSYCKEAATIEPGVVVAMRFRREITHVALVTGPTIIHAYEGAKRTVEHGYNNRWRKLTVGQWRLPGVEYEAGLNV